jgi:hypothetical protein
MTGRDYGNDCLRLWPKRHTFLRNACANTQKRDFPVSCRDVRLTKWGAPEINRPEFNELGSHRSPPFRCRGGPVSVRGTAKCVRYPPSISMRRDNASPATVARLTLSEVVLPFFFSQGLKTSPPDLHVGPSDIWSLTPDILESTPFFHSSGRRSVICLRVARRSHCRSGSLATTKNPSETAGSSDARAGRSIIYFRKRLRRGGLLCHLHDRW